MAKRTSGYERKTDDFYETPSWCVEAILPHIPDRVHHIFEPSAGKGAFLAVLAAAGYGVFGIDINEYRPLNILKQDFLAKDYAPSSWADAVIGNPPYNKSVDFIQKSLDVMRPKQGFVAMLLPETWDCAKGRRHLLGDCPVFAAKVVLTRRIKWFEGEGSPSTNHAFYCWDFCHCGAPFIRYIY